MKQISIEAIARKESGKGVARKLRAAGRLPGVLYGKGTENIPLSVDENAFIKAISHSRGERLFFSLELSRESGREKHLALIKEIQRHPVNERVRHVDFYEVFMDQEVTTEVPITIVGKARGVEIDHGVLDIVRRSLRISCLPSAIPNEILVDVSSLGLGETLHAADVVLPEGVRLADDAKATIVTITGTGDKEKSAEEEEGT